MAEDKKPKKTKRPTALKRDIQNRKKRLRNKVFKSRVATAIRALEKNLKEKSATPEHLSEVYKLVDKGVKIGVFKKNKAARFKSKFAIKYQVKAAA